MYKKINKIYIKIKVRVMLLRHDSPQKIKEDNMVPLGQTIHENTVFLELNIG